MSDNGKSLAEVKIHIGIFQEDAILPLLFVITIIPLNHILGKCTRDYKFTKSQENISHLMYMNDIKSFAKNEKNWRLMQTIKIYSQDIGMDAGINKCIPCR